MIGNCLSQFYCLVDNEVCYKLYFYFFFKNILWGIFYIYVVKIYILEVICVSGQVKKVGLFKNFFVSVYKVYVLVCVCGWVFGGSGFLYSDLNFVFIFLNFNSFFNRYCLIFYCKCYMCVCDDSVVFVIVER